MLSVERWMNALFQSNILMTKKPFIIALILLAVGISPANLIQNRRPAGGATLDDSGLLARYYFDDGTNGDTSTTPATDAAGSMDLAVDFGTSDAEWTVVSGSTGLEFLDTAGTGTASVSIVGSNAIRDGLDGSTVATIELVAYLTAGNSNSGRVFGTGQDDGEGSFLITVGSGNPGTTEFRINDDTRTEWDWATGTKDVWHIVLDTDAGTAENRTKVYKNGSLFTDDGSSISSGATINITTTEWLYAGNRQTSKNRESDLILYYAAVYDEAFTATRCDDHSTILTADDDTP